MPDTAHVHPPSMACNVMCPANPKTVKRRPNPVRRDLADEGRRLLRAQAVRSEGGHAYVAYLRERAYALQEGDPLPPELGDVVIFWNRHGFPRTAHVIGTELALIGEQHCQPVDSPEHLHLHVLSPLAYDRWEMNVPKWDGDGPRAGTWSPR